MDLRSLFDQAVALHRGGNFAAAETLYRQILRADAGSFPALHMLGYLEAQRGRYDEAIALLRKAVRAKPDDITARAHYAHALMAARRFDEALDAYDRVLAREPDHFEALYNRGVILSQLRRPAEALEALDRALALKPGLAAAWYNRGPVLVELERHRDAMDSYDRALALEPGYPPALANSAMLALDLCDWTRTAAASPQQLAAFAPPLTLLGYSSDKQLQRQCAARASRALAPSPLPALWRGEAYRHDRIRLAYVSADLRDHAVGAQIAQLIERHDRARFEVIGISTGLKDDSALRARLAAGFDRLHDFGGLNSDEIARRMREMEIDIAIDLGGHTGMARLLVFAWRPAPVQVTWLGYPGTTGADFFDYLIGDPVVTPAQDQPFYSERLVQLPDTYFPTDAARPIGRTPSRAEAGLPEQGFVFCSFNNAWKITPSFFDIWMRLLAQIPDSVLWLKQCNDAARANLGREAAARGIDPARLVFAPTAPLDVHLARHALAGLFLDTLPYNAHATAADALWAGLPVLTCKGEAFAGRVAAGLLQAMGLPELITETLADYEETALALARDPARLAALKRKLKDNLPAAPLFDGEGFRRHIEAAYTGMLEIRRAGDAPRGFSVAASR